MRNVEKLDEINKLFEIENKEKVVKSFEYNFYAIESMKDTILIDPDYLKANDINDKYCILKEIYSKRFFDFQEEMEDMPKYILEDIKKEEELERKVKNGEECFSQEEMKKGITYKLQDERIFQFFKVDDGFEFSIFDKKGKLQDGGVKLYRYFEVELEKIPKNYILEEMSKMISPIFNVDIIKNEKNKRLKDGLMEEDIKNIQIMYSREKLNDILNSEKAIKVCGKSSYTPTDFLKVDDKIFFRNKYIVSEKIWIEHPKSLEELLDHLENMQNEGFVIKIIPDKEYFKPFKDPEEDFYVTNNPNEFDYMEYKGYRTCYIEDTNTIVIHKIDSNEKESYTDYDETIVNRNYTSDELKKIIDKEYIKENNEEEEYQN